MASSISRRHRVIERYASHTKLVKKREGKRWKGFHAKLSERYGLVAERLTNAHHRVPLASLADGEVVGLVPRKYFAVLCPNSHWVIHYLDDPSDSKALRAIIRS